MKEQFKTLQIIFLGMLIGQLIFAVVANFIMTSGAITDTGVLIYLVPMVMIAGILGGNYIFKENLKKVIAQKPDADKKFKEYRKNSIIRWGIMEFGNVLAIIAAIIEANSFYFALFGIGLLFFATTRPNAADFMQQMELSAKDIS